MLVPVQNKMREQVNTATIAVMNMHTWYVTDQHYEQVVMKVQGKEDVSSAKAN